MGYLRKDQGLKSLRARILSENLASISLFRKLGFRQVGKEVDEEYTFLLFTVDFPP
jgi:L-amino acid N-acyltransferase YncA